MATWEYGVPLFFPTLADFQVSNVRAGVVATKDSNEVFAWFARDDGDDETGAEGVDWISNASAVHYRRKDVIAS